MKILMVSIFSNHFFNWTDQLKETGHEIYWLDVFDSRTQVSKIHYVKQIQEWRYRVNYPGRYFIKKHLPRLHKAINLVNERELAVVFEQKLKELQPDVIHSFAMHLSCYPIYEVMVKYPRLKWIFSSWGSDLFFYERLKKEALNMSQILSRVDYLFTDCKRDYRIAIRLGFRGKFLGVFPGGGGIDTKREIESLNAKNVFLLKGYEGKHGRCIAVLKALINLKKELSDYKIVIFGASNEVMSFLSQSSLNDWNNVTVYGKIAHDDVMELMSWSRIYVGNSMSDGMPNTLLEAIYMGAFPIQSNPGGATEEIVKNRVNGLLIENPEDHLEIRELILQALNNHAMVTSAIMKNIKEKRPSLKKNRVKHKVIAQYRLIEEDL